MNKVMFSSATDNWATPQVFFDELNCEFDFTLDPCADQFNHKCAFYYTKEQDGLSKDWGGERVFCNPPYGRDIGKWVQKAYEESQKKNTVVVMLIPARTDTRYFHDYIYGKAEIRFIRGRLKFGDSQNAAPFPSMVVIFGKNTKNVDPDYSDGIDPDEAADDDLRELLPFGDDKSATAPESTESMGVEL